MSRFIVLIVQDGGSEAHGAKYPILGLKGSFWWMNIIPKYVLCTALEKRKDEIIYF